MKRQEIERNYREKDISKRELTNLLKTYTEGGGMITRAQLAHAMGVKNPKNVDCYLIGLERIAGKYYLVSDVADRLLEQKDRKIRTV